MNGLAILHKARIILLYLLVLICLLLATLFAIFLSREWSYSPQLQNTLVVGFLLLYVVTAVLLYSMAVLDYHPWWDVVRMFAVLVGHIVSSVFFTNIKPSFSCRDYGTETACKELIFAIFVGCWFSSVTILCFANALGVMAFIPQPATPLPGTEENCLPSNPDRPEADSSMADEQQRFLPPDSTRPPVKVARGDGFPSNPDSIKVDGQAADNRTGLFTDDDEPREESLQRTDLPSSPGWFKGGSPAAERRTLLSRTLNELREEPSSLDGRDRDSFPVNSIQSLERLQNRNSDFSNESGSRSGTVFMRNTPGRDTSTDSASGSQRVYSFHNSSTPVSMLSRWSSMTRAGVGGGNNNRPRVRKIGPSKESLAPSTAQSSIANFPP